MPRYLVVAHQTAESEALVAELRQQQAGDATAEFVLLVPATPVVHLATWAEGETADVAHHRAKSARAALQRHGLNVVAAQVGDASPILAVEDALRQDPDIQAVIISTLAPGASRWLKRDAVSQLRARLEIPVTHIVGEPAPVLVS